MCVIELLTFVNPQIIEEPVALRKETVKCFRYSRTLLVLYRDDPAVVAKDVEHHKEISKPHSICGIVAFLHVNTPHTINGKSYYSSSLKPLANTFVELNSSLLLSRAVFFNA